MNVEEWVQQTLFALKDDGYKSFHCKLIPNVDPNRVIGVRTPQLRAFAKEFAKTPDSVTFMQTFPHTYYEENNLHACLIERMQDYDQVIAALEDFLPYVDNWATCDMLRPKVFRKHLPELLEHIKVWLGSERTYTVRFALEMLMIHFLDEEFQPKYLTLAAEVKSEEYYVRMMVAWFFATALAKQYEAALPYLRTHRLERRTHNKSIQKAIESYRITSEQKACLRTLRF